MISISHLDTTHQDIQDTDLTLHRRRADVISLKLLEQGIKPPYTLQEGTLCKFIPQENKYVPVKEKGKMEYVVYRENGKIRINLASGGHYFVGEGREKVVLAGEMEFVDGIPVQINDKSLTYSSAREFNYDRAVKMRSAQASALLELKVKPEVIQGMDYFVSLETIKAEGKKLEELSKGLSQVNLSADTSDAPVIPAKPLAP